MTDLDPADAPLQISPKGVELLSQGSHFFHELWPYIMEASDEDTLSALEAVCTWFRQLVGAISRQRWSDEVKESYIHNEQYYKRNGRNSPPNPLRLDPRQGRPLWYEWGADKCSFSSVDKFDEFCALAGVSAADGVEWEVYPRAFDPGDDGGRGRFSFLSEDGDVSFDCGMDPRVRRPGKKKALEGYAHYFGCTGEYDKVKKLEKWFLKNGWWEDFCHWEREYI